ncbi:MAG: ORF6N domain-containing protein, partial [Bacteroidales bacterium]|nr:ORF6N domain-containing protein [Bacteroidales bacterium]
DLAELYQVETRRINEQVKRNISRFPEDFMFQLNADEFSNLISQNATSKWGGLRKRPYAFTELGIAMLSSVLSSEIAIQVNINIMRAFVTMRHAISSIADQDLKIEKFEHKLDSLSVYIDDVLRDQNDINDDTATQLELINQTLAELQAENAVRKTFQERKPVGFKIENRKQ